jgi:hypothetical protein
VAKNYTKLGDWKSADKFFTEAQNKLNKKCNGANQH